MGRSVDEDMAIKIVAYECGEFAGLAKRIEKQIKTLPSAQPERRKGRWINDVAYYDEEGCPCIVTRCDQCGEPGFGRYCPYCGADMREENDG